MRVLALNCGSSSIRYAIADTETGACTAQRHQELSGQSHEEVLAHWVADWQSQRRSEVSGVEAIGHRVVHGGEHFKEAVRIEGDVLGAIVSVSHWAPLHNPANLAGIRALGEAFPDLPQVAVFDTAFHQSLPPHAFLYAVPYSLYREHGIRRYGFHGTSHRSAAHEALRRLKMPESGSRILVAHLGNGCSATAVRDGCSLDTSMGQSPLEGLVMGTRSGDVDPALHERLAALRGLDIAGVTSLLNRESGLLGLSELSGDMRELEAAASAGHAGALRAIEVFCYRLAKTLASLVVPLGGLDALVFTGGIGENSAGTRERTVKWLEPFGLSLDPQRNQNNGTHADRFIHPDGETPILVVTCDEEVAIAEETASQLAESR